MKILLIAIILLPILFIAARLGIAHYSQLSIATGYSVQGNSKQLDDCPESPNCQCSQATRSAQQVAPFDYSLNRDEVIAKLESVIAQQAGVEIKKSDSDYLWATYKTKLMGYLDDVEFLLDNEGVLQVRSASRLGKSDLGANKKRIDALRALLDGKI